ncbi:MAG: arylesterase [Planctomycetota bacterium]
MSESTFPKGALRFGRAAICGVAVSLAAAVWVACGPAAEREPAGSSTSGSPSDGLSPSNVESGPLVAFLGDSITAGLGVERDEAFPAILHRTLRERRFEFRVLNAGRSGDTTAGGVARVDWILAQSPALVVIELGGNDGLRGQPLDDIAANLRTLVTKVRGAGAEALLLGMRIPTSYGEKYAEGFAELYVDLSDELEVEVVPFFMEPVAGKPRFNQPDGIHPTVEGHVLLGKALAPVVERWLKESTSAGATSPDQ